MDTLAKIYKASVHDKKTLTEAALKLAEEVGEVAEAVNSYMETNGCAYKCKTHNDVIEEALDAIIIAGSLIRKVIEIEEGGPQTPALPPVILRMLNEKLKKWKKVVTEEYDEGLLPRESGGGIGGPGR
jgi:NTP pyrophosphatase (non-canonical NTP hydrolase)